MGLAVVDVSETGGAPVVLWSQDVYVGDLDHPERYGPMLVSYLNNIYNDWSFSCVGAETPPMIQENIKTTAMLQRVFGVVDGWAAMRSLPVRYIAPVTIKVRARRVTGEPDLKRTDKSLVREAVEKLIGGKACRTSHENDAVFAAWACYGGT